MDIGKIRDIGDNMDIEDMGNISPGQGTFETLGTL